MGPLAALLLAALGSSSAAPSATAGTEIAAPRARESAAHGPVDPFALAEPSAAKASEASTTSPPTRTAAATHSPEAVRGRLLDPFAIPPRAPTSAGPAPTRAPGRAISADLKDPFVLPGGPRVPLRPIRDLRDPFELRPDGSRPGECVTGNGVPLQRPKSLRTQSKKCPGHDAPLLNPFATA